MFLVSLIQFFDFSGILLTLTVNDKSKRKTFFGGLLNLSICTCLIVSIAFSFSENYYKKEVITDKVGFFLPSYQI
jgi:hypothetical protein